MTRAKFLNKTLRTLPVYYTFDEGTGNILIDLYEIEQEAIRRMEKAYPKKKVDSIYVT